MSEQEHAEIISEQRKPGYWDGFEDALGAVEEWRVLYGTTAKAIAALRVLARIGRRENEREPDPDQVAALWNLGHELGRTRGEPLLSHDEARELVRRGVTVRKDT